MPSLESTQDDYSLSRPLYMFFDSRTKPSTRKFVDFCSSPKGQDIVKTHGFVSLKRDWIKPQPISVHEKNNQKAPPLRRFPSPRIGLSKNVKQSSKFSFVLCRCCVKETQVQQKVSKNHESQDNNRAQSHQDPLWYARSERLERKAGNSWRSSRDKQLRKRHMRSELVTCAPFKERRSRLGPARVSQNASALYRFDQKRERELPSLAVQMPWWWQFFFEIGTGRFINCAWNRLHIVTKPWHLRLITVS